MSTEASLCQHCAGPPKPPYVPDHLVRLTTGVTLVLEIKGIEDEQDCAKYQAAQHWVSAVHAAAQRALEGHDVLLVQELRSSSYPLQGW